MNYLLLKWKWSYLNLFFKFDIVWITQEDSGLFFVWYLFCNHFFYQTNFFGGFHSQNDVPFVDSWPNRYDRHYYFYLVRHVQLSLRSKCLELLCSWNSGSYDQRSHTIKRICIQIYHLYIGPTVLSNIRRYLINLCNVSQLLNISIPLQNVAAILNFLGCAPNHILWKNLLD